MGKLELPKIQGKYDTGQLFLHKIFGYRGVILFPWLAQVYDRDVPNSNNVNNQDTVSPLLTDTDRSDDASASGTVSSSEVKGKTNTFYQVLIDSRDCPFIVSTIIGHTV